jgi:hypothetical protein
MPRDDASAEPGRNLTPFLSLGLAALLVVSGAAIGLGMAMSGGAHRIMWGGSPVAVARAPEGAPVAAGAAGFQLTALPQATVERYTFAKEHATTYAQIPCFCGCATMLGHRNLAECFVRPDGAWESHAAGCQVCLGESRMVARMMGRGMGPTVMRDRIVAGFGAPMMGGSMMDGSA